MSAGLVRAAVFQGAGLALEVRSFALPELGPGEMLVRVRCATICGSDLHTIAGRRKSPVPAILGHEMVGEVAGVGAGLAWKPGMRVTWSMVWSCGNCFYCDRELRPKCEHLWKFGHEAISEEHQLSGGFGEYCLLPVGTSVFAVPEAVSDRVGSPANCATATVAAVLRRCGDLRGESVLVLGCGMLGIEACAMARWKGASVVAAVDVDERRQEMARRFGAGGELPERGADVVLDFSGNSAAMAAGLQRLRTGGRMILAGAVLPVEPLPIEPEQVVRRMWRIEGVHNYEPRDLEEGLQFLAATAERYPYEELVVGDYGLDELNEALALAMTERPPRVAVRPAKR